MKRKLLPVFLSIICALCLALGLTACNKGTTNGGTTDNNTNNEQTDNTDGDSSNGDEQNGDTEQGGETACTHTLVKTDAAAATCIKEGNIEYWYCSDCGKYFSDGNGTMEITLADTVTAKTAHTPAAAVKESEVAATCTQTGSYDSVIYCTVCNAEISRETTTTAMSAHTYSGYSSNENGHWQECSVCGGKTSSVSHTFENSVCSVCGYTQIVASENLAYTLSTDGTYYTVSGIGTCSDTDIVIPSTYDGKSVMAIAASAFVNQTQIKSIYIPKSVTTIGSGAFSGCSNLVSIILPFVGGSVDATSASASTLFGYIFGTTSYIGGTKTQQYYSSSESATYYYIPSTLTTVTITGGNILFGAFYYCSALTSITISESVASIGDYAFWHCTALTSINVDFGNTAYKSIDGNLYSYDGTTLIQYAVGKTDTSFTIPNSVTSIRDHAFFYCTALTSVTLGSCVTSIGDSAFFCCTALESITIPNSVTFIGSRTFGNCTALTSVTFENTSEWYVTTTKEAESGTDIDVTDISENVDYLTSTYCTYYWYRSED